MTTPRHAYTLTVSIFLLIEGVWGLFTPVIFGFLTSNLLHAVIHIVLGVCGILAARTAHARGFLIFLGVLLLAVGVLWFVPPFTDLLARTLNLDEAVAILNILVGALSLAMAAKGSNRVVDRI
jgi:hypothetical protein